MAFTSETAAAAGQRSKRTGNKLTSKLKGKLTDIMETIVDDISTKFSNDELTIQDKLNFVKSILPFLMPKKSSNLKINWSQLDESEQAEVLEQLKNMLKDE